MQAQNSVEVKGAPAVPGYPWLIELPYSAAVSDVAEPAYSYQHCLHLRTPGGAITI